MVVTSELNSLNHTQKNLKRKLRLDLTQHFPPVGLDEPKEVIVIKFAEDSPKNLEFHVDTDLCSHLFFSVKYERIKFLVIALKSSVEVYAWAPKPYHKFMAFKVTTSSALESNISHARCNQQV